MKLLKSIRMTVALILTLSFIALVPLQTTAAANGGKYVSEVYVAYGKDAEEAKKTLSDKGFTPVEGNLNDGGKTYAMMGYKTTDDIRDSITDLAVMNMHGDYSVEDYKNLLKGQKTEIAEFLTEFMAVIKEYRSNLKDGKAKATYVHDVLNNYTEGDTGMKMGDLLNSETLQDKVGIEKSIEAENPEKLPDLVTILLQGNAQVIKSMETLLSMATDTADNTWLDRFAETDYDALLDKVGEDRPELNTETKRMQYLDNLYGEEAAVLGIEASELCGTLNDYTAADLKIETATEEDIKNTFGDIENDVDAMLEYRKWLTAGTIYEGLKNYEGGNYKKGELLDFFLEEQDPEDVETYIPMAAALSEGQRCGLPFVSLEQLLTFAFTTEESWKNYVEENKADFGNLEDVSVYQNIDRDLYKDDGSIALTGAAQRANNIADGTTGTKEEQMDTLSKITAISWAATAGCALVTAIAVVVKNRIVYNFAYNPYTKEVSDIFLDYVYDNEAYASLKRWDTKDQYLSQATRARFAVKLSRIFTVVTMFVAVASTVLTIIDLCRDKSIEQLPIPNYLVNNYTDADGGSYTLNYKAVECNRMEYFGDSYTKQKGSSADLLADEGKQWLVLYASKNSKAGKPLTPDFVVQEKNTAPSGYEGFVHLIGEKGAVNVISGAFKNYSTFSTVWQSVAGDYSMYIFSKLSNDVKTYDESAGNMTASTLGDGMWAIFGFGGLIIGGALGAAIAVLVNKNKKEKGDGMMKVLKGLKALVALVLTLTFIALVPLNTAAAANNGKYVSEVYVAYGKDADAAKKTLSDKGFTPVEGNLNDGGKTYAMMGYKTTDDIRESITDLAVMNMDGNYNTTEYSEILRAKEVKVSEMLTDFMAAIREYRANLKAGKTKATVVRDILNKLTDDDTGMKMGDLLNSETLQDKVGIKQSINHQNPDKLPNLLTIFMQGNSFLITMIETLLAISADTADNTWIDRFSELDYDTLLDQLEDTRPDLNTDTKRVQYLDNEYGAVVSQLSTEVAQLRADLIGYEQTGLDVTKATQEDINNTFGNVDAIEDEEAQAAVAQKILNWSETGAIYEYLKNYEGGNFKKGELLEFFKEEPEDDESIYPMAAALSEGQRGGMEFVTLRSLIRYAFLQPEELKKEIESDSELSKTESESVYKGINRELFNRDGSIAYTAEATRTNNLASQGGDTTSWLQEHYTVFQLWALTVLTGLGAVSCKAVLKNLVRQEAYYYSHRRGGIAYANAQTAGVADLGYKIFKYACIVLALISAGYTIYELAQTEEVKLEPIPKYFVDTKTTEDGSSYELYYEAVQCNRADYNQNQKQTGSSADLCADEGKQWLVLYASKNSMAGKPLTPNFNYNTKAESPADMSGSIHMIGENGATNVAKEEYRNYSKLYAAYNSVKNIFTDQCKAYVFYKLSDISKTYDESAGNMTASAVGGGMIAIWGFGGLALGAVLGVLGTILVKRKKKTEV